MSLFPSQQRYDHGARRGNLVRGCRGHILAGNGALQDTRPRAGWVLDCYFCDTGPRSLSARLRGLFTLRFPEHGLMIASSRASCIRSARPAGCGPMQVTARLAAYSARIAQTLGIEPKPAKHRSDPFHNNVLSSVPVAYVETHRQPGGQLVGKAFQRP